MATLQTSVNMSGDIQSSDITFKNGVPKLTEEAALMLVVQDSERSENFVSQQQWGLLWRESDILYQCPRSIQQWEGITVTRANVQRFTVATHVNSIVPQLMGGLFYETPPFVLRPRPGTSQDTIRQKTSVLAACLDLADFKENTEAGTFNYALFGTGIWKWGWHKETRTEKRYVRKRSQTKVPLPITGEVPVYTKESDEFEIKEIEVTQEYPFLEHRPHTEIKVSPSLRIPDIRKAPYVIDTMYMNYYDLEKLRDNESYTLPSVDELKALFFPPNEQASPVSSVEQSTYASGVTPHAQQRDMKDSADPLMNVLLVEERVDENMIITVLNKKLVIRNEENEFHCINYFSNNWWNVPKAFWGIGCGRLVGQDQRVTQGVTNAALDILSLACNQGYVISKGANVQTQQV